MECYSCYAISRLDFVINASIDVDDGAKCITMCCQDHLGEIPSANLTNDSKENLKRFIAMRHSAMIQGFSDYNKSNTCTKCMFYYKKIGHFRPLFLLSICLCILRLVNAIVFTAK